MKRLPLLVLICFLAFSGQAEAQFLKKLTKKLEKKLDKTTKKLEEKADKQIDKMLDLGEDEQTQPQDEMDTYPVEDPMSNGTFSDSMDGVQWEETAPMDQEMSDTPSTSFEAYTKYDFVPGETLVAYEDFTADVVGDLPQKWNTNLSAEVVTVNAVPGNWMRIGQGIGSYVFNELPGELPEDFTLEFDIMRDYNPDTFAFKRHLYVLFSSLENPNMYLNKHKSGKEYTAIKIANGSGSGGGVSIEKKTLKKGMGLTGYKPHIEFSKKGSIGTPIHIAILKKGTRMKVYVNEDKVLDIPRAVEPETVFSTLRLESEISTANDHFFISNFKFATGVETSERLFDNGSYQAHGITFETGSAQIKPSSYATLKLIAQAMQSNATAYYEVIGHTDSDGDDSINIPLSQERAQAVQTALQSEFGIDASRITTIGKGATMPLSTENTTVAKAKNRRVEIKKI
ncbi:OmpA family protein [Dokdonia sinensis]|uniref:OmpA family protein n=1 Tax=Dokdonia sinensis TaxID=2479847 RepID=A0A3M0GAH6_9FLAO|nr:OmpA family protein [Dokdonia sinensis]RMB58019.1 OmpA family protein [Dokdonia sinensis]